MMQSLLSSSTLHTTRFLFNREKKYFNRQNVDCDLFHNEILHNSVEFVKI